MTAQNQWFILLTILAVGGGIAYSVWMNNRARDIAELWLLRNKYKVHSLKTAWFSFNHFSPQLFRNDDRAVEFRAVVSDQSLGGTGEMWLRVWLDRRGMIDREPDISWARMPVRTAEDTTLEDRNRAAQLDLLRRIAAGQTSFSVAQSESAAAFDELAEHLLALQRRGLITCDARPSRTPGSFHDVVDNGALTDTGRSYLKVIDSQS